MKAKKTDFPTEDELRHLIAGQRYMTLATTGKDGMPHATPVFFAEGRWLQFYWLSATNSQHSKNIKETGKAAAVIFDSTVPQGTGIGFYFNGVASLVTNTYSQLGYPEGEKAYVIDLLLEKADDLPSRKKLLATDCPRQLYVLQVHNASFNGAEMVDGIWVDKRVDWPIYQADFRRCLKYGIAD